MGLEHFLTKEKDVAESLAVITRKGSERIIDFAFKFARDNERKKVTLCHKANILKYTSCLFLDVGYEVAERYPDVEFDEKIIDATCMHLVIDPHQFDVMVTTYMIGDILTDLTAGLVGGLGLIPGANIGDDAALFEAVHGSAPDIAGKNLADPAAVIILEKSVERGIIVQDIGFTVLYKRLSFTHRLSGYFFEVLWNQELAL